MAVSQVTFSSTNVLRFLLFLAALYTLYFTKSLLIPLVLALLIALLLNPLVSFLKKWKIPRTVSSVLLLITSISGIVLLTSELMGPFQKWAQALPEYCQVSVTGL